MSFMVGPVNGYGVSSFCGYFQKVYGANGYSVEQSLDVFWLIQKQMKRKHFNPRREHSDMGKEGWRSVCRGLVEAHMCEEHVESGASNIEIRPIICRWKANSKPYNFHVQNN
ncbi:uncharacterized protein LOC130747092 isoform X2 [Lotus japonicus]|uniref:uncharacterized protein LOC130747092 isoform X2 n=1 Tax=Lotus japonicus TaxID=34305 RepID=UPI0025871BE1|nr:uncharacterized protein LOC130747092 isoform X2 [Lotus japonicus]